MSQDPRCCALARAFLANYRLSLVERADETERLAQQIQDAVEAHLEGLAHRRRSA